MTSCFPWWYPIGAQFHGDGTAFRVWADNHKEVSVFAQGVQEPLVPNKDGYFCGAIGGLKAGDTYAFFVDGEGPFPDPASRYQPQGPHGPSQIVDPAQFSWTDQSWRGIHLKGQAIYEMHIGTFTTAGTWRAAIRELRALVEL